MAIVRKIYSAVSPEINTSKVRVLEALAEEWKRALPHIFTWYWKIFLKEGRFIKTNDKRVARIGSGMPTTSLVTSMQQTMVNAMHGLCTSWSANASNAWSKTLPKHLDSVLKNNANADALRHQVLWINKCQSWCASDSVVQDKWIEYAKEQKGTPISWDPQALVIARTWFEDQLHRGKRRKPSPFGIPVIFHQNSIRWNDNTRDQSSKWTALHADQWACISTTVRRKKLWLPVMHNLYWHERTKDTVKIHKTATLEKRHGRWYIGRTFELAPTPLTKHAMSTDVVGVDMGLHHRIVTSQGDVFGSGWMNDVKAWDTKLLALQQRLQKSGVKRLSQSTQYRNLVQRFRAATEYGIRHALNRIVSLYTPDTMVMEDLDLQQMQEHVSKPMARRLARLGTGIMKQHLMLKAEEYGFAVEVIDPSYTSQMCHACGYANSTNRRGDAFQCTACGHTDHADINAAKNIQECFLDASLHPQGHKRTKAQVHARWIARMKATQALNEIDPCVIGHADPCVVTQTPLNALPCSKGISNILRDDGMSTTVDKKTKNVRKRVKILHDVSTRFSD